MREVIQIGDRAFRSMDVVTLERDVRAMGLVRSAGLDALPLEPGESADEYSHRLLSHLMRQSEVFDLLGTLLSPVDLEEGAWEPAVAEDVATYLKRQTDPQAKAVVRQVLLSVLIPFFQSGLASLTRTAASSSSVGASAAA